MTGGGGTSFTVMVETGIGALFVKCGTVSGSAGVAHGTVNAPGVLAGSSTSDAVGIDNR